MGTTIDTFDAALKVHYTPDRVEDMSIRDYPLVAMLKKYEKFTGLSLPIPVIWGNPQTISPSFSRSQAQAATANNGTRVDAFNLTRTKLYGTVHIDNESILASVGNEGSFISAKVAEIDGVINAYNKQLAQALYRSGYGVLGRVGAISSATVTLGNSASDSTPSDAMNFEVGQQVVFSQSEAGHVLRGGAGFLTVLSFDPDAGTVTFDANVSTITSSAVGDWMFLRDAREDSATPTRLMVSGLEAWFPDAAPSSTAFFGVDRSVNPQRLAGTRFNGASMNIEEALQSGARRVIKNGGKPDYCFVNHENYDRLQRSMGTRVQYVEVEVKAGIGFRGVKIVGPGGDINVMPDVSCPPKRAFMLTMDSLKLYSLGKACRPLDTDGLSVLRQATSDGVEARFGGYLNLGCNAPGRNGNIQLAA